MIHIPVICLRAIYMCFMDHECEVYCINVIIKAIATFLMAGVPMPKLTPHPQVQRLASRICVVQPQSSLMFSSDSESI